MSSGRFLTTEAAASELGTSRVTVWRVCRDNAGFAIRLGGTYRIPAEHVERVRRGETPAAIAAEVRAGGAPEQERNRQIIFDSSAALSEIDKVLGDRE